LIFEFGLLIFGLVSMVMEHDGVAGLLLCR